MQIVTVFFDTHYRNVYTSYSFFFLFLIVRERFNKFDHASHVYIEQEKC